MCVQNLLTIVLPAVLSICFLRLGSKSRHRSHTLLSRQNADGVHSHSPAEAIIASSIAHSHRDRSGSAPPGIPILLRGNEDGTLVQPPVPVYDSVAHSRAQLLNSANGHQRHSQPERTFTDREQSEPSGSFDERFWVRVFTNPFCYWVEDENQNFPSDIAQWWMTTLPPRRQMTWSRQSSFSASPLLVVPALKLDPQHFRHMSAELYIQHVFHHVICFFLSGQ